MPAGSIGAGEEDHDMRTVVWTWRAGAALLAAVVLGLAVPGTPALDVNGFLREKGEGDVAFSFTNESYDEFWVGEMSVAPPEVGEVETNSFAVWLAYGITDDLTLVGTLPHVDAEGDGTESRGPAAEMFSESGLQDVSLMGLYRLGSAGSSQFLGGLGVRTPASDYEENNPVDIGDGSTDWLARFVYHLQRGGFYWSQQIGYDLRGDDVPDGYPLYTEVGYTKGRTTFNGFFSKLIADGGTDIGDPGFTFPSNKEEYERAGAKVYVRVGQNFGVAVSGFTTLDGRNTGEASGASLGLNVGF
jgi:hypothetical protein